MGFNCYKAVKGVYGHKKLGDSFLRIKKTYEKTWDIGKT